MTTVETTDSICVRDLALIETIWLRIYPLSPYEVTALNSTVTSAGKKALITHARAVEGASAVNTLQITTLSAHPHPCTAYAVTTLQEEALRDTVQWLALLSMRGLASTVVWMLLKHA